MPITLITGVPGSGKTAFCVEMILAELKKCRKIYSIGIPDLIAQHTIPDDTLETGERVFAVEQAGNPRTWQKGTWLSIDSYTKIEESESEYESEEDFDKAASAWTENGNGREDKGALIIIDECQTYFRPRSSSAKVPDFIAAFEVHRHQGLDFWLLTQNPNLIDANLRKLVGRHIHIRTTSLGKKRLEWAEVQNPDNKAARIQASSSTYKPNPKVFELYRSATKHTKTKIRLPNTVYYLGISLTILIVLSWSMYSSISDRVNLTKFNEQNPVEIKQGEAQRGAATRAPTAQPTGADFNTTPSFDTLSLLMASSRLLYSGYMRTPSKVYGSITFQSKSFSVSLTFDDLRNLGVKFFIPDINQKFLALKYKENEFLAFTASPVVSQETQSLQFNPPPSETTPIGAGLL